MNLCIRSRTVETLQVWVQQVWQVQEYQILLSVSRNQLSSWNRVQIVINPKIQRELTLIMNKMSLTCNKMGLQCNRNRASFTICIFGATSPTWNHHKISE